MSGESDLPEDLVQAIGAALLLCGQSGGGLFGQLSYATPKHFPRPPELSFEGQEEDEQ